jgi:hypothetical protein
MGQDALFGGGRREDSLAPGIAAQVSGGSDRVRYFISDQSRGQFITTVAAQLDDDCQRISYGRSGHIPNYFPCLICNFLSISLRNAFHPQVCNLFTKTADRRAWMRGKNARCLGMSHNRQTRTQNLQQSAPYYQGQPVG